jgi:hypothetical protein
VLCSSRDTFMSASYRDVTEKASGHAAGSTGS